MACHHFWAWCSCLRNGPGLGVWNSHTWVHPTLHESPHRHEVNQGSQSGWSLWAVKEKADCWHPTTWMNPVLLLECSLQEYHGPLVHHPLLGGPLPDPDGVLGRSVCWVGNFCWVVHDLWLVICYHDGPPCWLSPADPSPAGPSPAGPSTVSVWPVTVAGSSTSARPFTPADSSMPSGRVGDGITVMVLLSGDGDNAGYSCTSRLET